jgi:hypothetical protein
VVVGEVQAGALGGAVAVAAVVAAAVAGAVLRVAHRDTNVRRALRPVYGYLSTVLAQAHSSWC